MSSYSGLLIFDLEIFELQLKISLRVVICRLMNKNEVMIPKSFRFAEFELVCSNAFQHEF